MFLRSDINRSIIAAIAFFQKQNIHLPPYAFFSPKKWLQVGAEYDEIKACHLGWDVTDFGTGDFTHFGRTIFTLRNGLSKSTRYQKPYAQKIMHLVEGKKSLIHLHHTKHEDIINHSGGHIAIKIWHSTKSNSLSIKSVNVVISGVQKKVKPGATISLHPGESVYLAPGTFHQFWAKPGRGDVVSMEVSSVNNDYTDNFWLNGGLRFPPITNDVPPQFLLCHEYKDSP